jgi:S-(hydroxymethyl)mycothiol dehydrogenase
MAGIGAVDQHRRRHPGQSVAVFGCGGVGDAAIAGARLAGASTIIGVDIDDRKLEWAKGFGATHVCNSKETDPVEFVRSVTGGFGADVCIEAIGHPEVYKQAFEARDLAGTVVLVGVPNPEMTLELPFIEVFGRGGALKSSWYGDCLPSRDFPMLIDCTSRAGSTSTGSCRRRSGSTASRRRSTRWSAARCSAAWWCCTG